MGGPAKTKKTGGDKKGSKVHKQRQRQQFEARFVDQVWEDIRKPPSMVHTAGAVGPMGTTDKSELDADVPGQGRFYCIACSRYFQTAVAFADHEKSKPHKRRVKFLLESEKPHSQNDADAAAGMGAADNGEKLRPVAMQL